MIAESPRGTFRTETDSRGGYWLEVPDLEIPFRVHAGAGIGTPSRDDVHPGTTAVDFELPALADLVINVQDADRAVDLQRFVVSVRRAGEQDPWWPAQSARERDADGFRFRSLLGTVAVKIQRRGYATRILEGVSVSADGRTRLEIGLESAPPR